MTKPSTKAVARRGRGRGVVVSGYSRTTRVAKPERQPGVPLPAPVPESALYRELAVHLAKAGYTCWRDVSFLGSWIDLLALREDGHSIAVELKVTAWRRAWQQALRIRSAAHETYIGIWAPYVHRALTDEAREALDTSRIGLYSINGICDVKLAATQRTPRHAEHVVFPARPSHKPR
jgi:hypothetical protein